MTVRGSDAAIPAGDDAWDDQADSSFVRFLPVLLGDAFACGTLEELAEAICSGVEELVADVDARLELHGREDHGARIAIAFHPGEGTDVVLPLVHAGRTLAELRVSAGPGTWIGGQQRDQLRAYGDLVAPMLGLHLNRNELAHAALTDDLTGLPNRRALDRELDRTCARGSLCLLLLDVDGLKEVNDRLGYEQGDQLIMTLARTLTAVVKDGEVAARMGGDEFIVILPGATPKRARKRAKRIQRAFSRQPLAPGIASISGGVSIGVVEARDGETPRQLVRRAARSMRGQKRRRRTDPG